MSGDLGDILPSAVDQRIGLLAKLSRLLGMRVDSDINGIIISQTLIDHPTDEKTKFRIMILDPSMLRLMTQLIYVEEQIVIEAARTAKRE